MKDQLSTDAAGNLQLQIDGKASTSHTHVVANITDFPTALPADGGDADTVTGYTVGKSVPANAVFTDTIPVQQSAKLTVAGWQGTAAPYTQVVSVTGVTVSNNVLFDFASDITASELDVGMSAMLRATGQAAGQMTIKAFGDKPTVELPVQFIILG
jgi:hypothetical protein